MTAAPSHAHVDHVPMATGATSGRLTIAHATKAASARACTAADVHGVTEDHSTRTVARKKATTPTVP